MVQCDDYNAIDRIFPKKSDNKPEDLTLQWTYSNMSPAKSGPSCFGNRKPPKKCKCCEIKLRNTDRSKSKVPVLGKGKYRCCSGCSGPVCKSCGQNDICHECVLKESIKLDPTELMKLDRKTLLEYLRTLHCRDYEFQTLESKYLVKHLLARYCVHEEWDPNKIDYYSSPQMRRNKKVNTEVPVSQKTYVKEKPKKPARRTPAQATDVRSFISPALGDIKAAAYFDQLSTKQLESFLGQHSIDTKGFTEKHELKSIAVQLWQQFLQNETRASGQIQGGTPGPRQTRAASTFQHPRTQGPYSLRVPSLKDVSTLREIDRFSFNELAILLHKYNRDPHRYAERQEMVNEVKMLWNQRQGEANLQKDHSVDGSVRYAAHQPRTSALPNQSSRNDFEREGLPTRQLGHSQMSNNAPSVSSRDVSFRPPSSRRNDFAGSRPASRMSAYQAESLDAAYEINKDSNYGDRKAANSVFYREANNFTPNGHQISFVPEISHIPLQTVKVERLPTESASLDDFDRTEDISALSNRELADLLQKHSVNYVWQSRTNHAYMVDMVTKLWLEKKGANALAEDIIAKARASRPTSDTDMLSATAVPAVQMASVDNTAQKQENRDGKEVAIPSLLDIASPSDIETFGNAQLKAILRENKRNPIFYQERRDLVLEVRLLWERAQKQQIEGKTVGKNTAQRQMSTEQAESATTKPEDPGTVSGKNTAQRQTSTEQAESATAKPEDPLRQTDHIRQTELLRRSFFSQEIQGPAPSPRSSLLDVGSSFGQARNSSSSSATDDTKEEKLPPQSPPPVIVEPTETVSSYGTNEPKEVHLDIAGAFNASLPNVLSEVKPYEAVYPRDRDILTSQSSFSECYGMKSLPMAKHAKAISLADIRAPEEILTMNIGDIRKLLEKYSVEIHAGAEKGHLIELVTKLWDKRQTQGWSLARTNSQQWDRFKRSKSTEVVYAEIVHVSRNKANQQFVRPEKTLAAESVAISNGQNNAFTDNGGKSRTDLHRSSQIDANKTANSATNENVCCICNSRPPDSVLLECGHMTTCMTCSSELKECPICHQYVVRVLRVFKS